MNCDSSQQFVVMSGHQAWSELLAATTWQSHHARCHCSGKRFILLEWMSDVMKCLLLWLAENALLYWAVLQFHCTESNFSCSYSAENTTCWVDGLGLWALTVQEYKSLEPVINALAMGLNLAVVAKVTGWTHKSYPVTQQCIASV